MDEKEEEIASDVREFVDRFLIRNRYFTPKEDLDDEDAEGDELKVLYLMGGAIDARGLHLTFEHGASVDLEAHNPKDCAVKVVEAVKKQFPDVAQRYQIFTHVNKA